MYLHFALGYCGSAVVSYKKHTNDDVSVSVIETWLKPR